MARAPNEVWTWDISWLPGPVKGLFFYLYLIVDLYSRKIVGWEVYARESAEYAAEVVRRAVRAEGCVDQPRVLHADNGSPMKGETLLETLYRLGIATSYSRPRTSNDNPYSEALFRTWKSGRRAIRRWMAAVRKSGLDCFDKFLTTLENRMEIITNYFISRSSSGWVEGLNNKIKVLKRRSYGIKNLGHLFGRIWLDLRGYEAFAH